MGVRKPRSKPRKRRSPRRPAPGASPVTLVGQPDAGPTRVRAIAYGGERFEEVEGADLDTLRRLRAAYPVLWVDVTGLGDVARLQALGDLFGLHPLALEDVVNGHQRVKLERHADHLFFVAYMAEGDDELGTEQLNLFLGRDFVVTVRERWDAPLAPVRARAARPEGRMRRAGPDYLAYALLDSVVDHYFPVLEVLSDRLEALEDEALERPGPDLVHRLQRTRRDLQALRRAVWPLRDVLNEVMRSNVSGVVDPKTQVYLRDLHDHVLRVVEILETYRELASSLMDLYLSALSNRMNEVMKVLTIIATIFIPLSFVTGLYGMNFDPGASKWNMPELNWRYGYFYALGLMGAVAAGLLVYFRHKGWIGPPRHRG